MKKFNKYLLSTITSLLFLSSIGVMDVSADTSDEGGAEVNEKIELEQNSENEAVENLEDSSETEDNLEKDTQEGSEESQSDENDLSDSKDAEESESNEDDLSNSEDAEESESNEDDLSNSEDAEESESNEDDLSNSEDAEESESNKDDLSNSEDIEDSESNESESTDSGDTEESESNESDLTDSEETDEAESDSDSDVEEMDEDESDKDDSDEDGLEQQMKIQTMSLDSSIQELNERSELKAVAYHATVTDNTGNRYTSPVELNGSVQIGEVSNYMNQDIIVRKEGNIAGRTWVLAEKDENYIGWFLKKKITPAYEQIVSDKTVAYNGLMETNGRYQIFNTPAYTEGNYQVSNSNEYTGDSVIVRGEIETDYSKPRVWTLIEINGELKGWINSRALTPVYNEVKDEKTVAYDGKVNTNGRYQIFSRPAYTEGNHQVADSSDHYGEDVIVRGEIETDYYGGTTWSLLESGGKEIGWINSSGVTPEYETITDEKIIAYEGQVDTNGRYQLFSRPAYTEGNHQIADSSNYYGEDIIARRRIETEDNHTWLLLESNGNELGWINERAIEANYDKVTTSRSLDHPRVIRNLSGRYQLFNAPAYTKGSYQVGNILDYAGQEGMITQEQVTRRAHWHLLSVNGEVLGWINDKGLRKPRIYVDSGHGGNDSGASHGGVHEKDLNLKTSEYLKNQLEATGYYNVIMSRDDDTFLELEERSSGANEQNADIFVSVHYNSMGGSGNARGIETFIHHRVPSGFGQETNHSKFKTDNPRIKDSLDLANLIHSNLIQDTGMRDRGVKGNNYHVVRETEMPAVLLELGFLDNATERNLVNNSSYQQRASRAVVKGINRYFKD